jgi:myo-inositol 2-dehydrogenase/D-chiro-inositol 1-dehydrogenase
MISFALLGCGRIGAMHARNLAKAEGGRLATVYDPVTAAAQAVAERHGCTVARSVEDALHDVDAVLIATSTATHAGIIELAAKAGKAILCEKPIDLSLDRVRACRKAIEGCSDRNSARDLYGDLADPRTHHVTTDVTRRPPA